MNRLDAVVVGAGPTGLACGIQAGAARDRRPSHDLDPGETHSTEALKYYRRVAEHYRLNIHQYERVERILGEDNAFEVHMVDRDATMALTG